MRMRIHIRIRFYVLGASVSGVVIPRGGACTALADGAVPPASSMMLVAVAMVVDIIPASAVRF
jgi:hypothetical protein